MCRIAPEVNLDAGQKRFLSLEQKTKATDEINRPIGLLLPSLSFSLFLMSCLFFHLFLHLLYLIHKRNISKQILPVLRSPDGNKKTANLFQEFRSIVQLSFCQDFGLQSKLRGTCESVWGMPQIRPSARISCYEIVCQAYVHSRTWVTFYCMRCVI